MWQIVLASLSASLVTALSVSLTLWLGLRSVQTVTESAAKAIAESIVTGIQSILSPTEIQQPTGIYDLDGPSDLESDEMNPWIVVEDGMKIDVRTGRPIE